VVIRIIFTVMILFSFFTYNAFAGGLRDVNENLIVNEGNPVTAKIKSFLNEKTYNDNKAFINVIFDPKSAYYIDDRVNVVKIIKTLKDNGLLNLFFKAPQAFSLTFKTNGSPIFFIRIMDDVLSDIGYFRYLTTAVQLDASEFSWTINLTSEYMTDPIILQTALQKSGCKIIDITRNSAKKWTYTIDMSNAELNVPTFEDAKKVQLKQILYPRWFNVSKIRILKVYSSLRNHWYPYISYYDASLHLVKLLKRDKVSKSLSIVIPKSAKYIKITDLYTLKNLRDGLTFSPIGTK